MRQSANQTQDCEWAKRDDSGNYWEDEEQEEEVDEEDEEEEFIDPVLAAELEEFARMGLPTGFTATTKHHTRSRSRRGGRPQSKSASHASPTHVGDPEGTVQLWGKDSEVVGVFNS
jgi:hypothetical protein